MFHRVVQKFINCDKNLFNKLLKFKGNVKFYAKSSRPDSIINKSLIKEGHVQKYLNSTGQQILSSTNHSTNNTNHQLLIYLFSSRTELINNLESLSNLENEKTEDSEWNAAIEEEKLSYEEELNNIEYQLLNALVPQNEDANAVVFEVTAGIGGKEAMLFTKDLFEMYNNYFYYKSWKNFVAEYDSSDLGGLRHASCLVEGQNILKHLQHETGVHRVQRVPATEKSGRIHTSTVTVSVYPQPTEVDIHLSEKDLIFETKRSSGAGGQHVNTTDSAVRLTHVPTGIVIEAQTDRSQIKNRQIALQRLRAKLYQIECQQQEDSIRTSRKSQVGTSARSDKVRTYNYPQDRITDHRISESFHSLQTFLRGEEMLDTTIQKLTDFTESEHLIAFINSLKLRE